MSLRSLRLVAAACLVLGSIRAWASPLRICADPDNLPFSNRAAAGFDNEIASLIGHDLHRNFVFVWSRTGRGFLREQFNKNICDVLLGVPAGLHGVAVTAPYYTSSYAFVTPARQRLQLASFSDPRLSGKRIGLQILDEDLSPPSIPLIRAGHASQLVGFESFGSHEGDAVKAVADGRVGVAVVWGPVAGYFANRSPVPLTISPVPSTYKFSGIPFTYSIGFGVHPQDRVLLQQLNQSIQKLQPQINTVLATFSVPIVKHPEEAK